jgi:replicative DNA helicase
MLAIAEAGSVPDLRTLQAELELRGELERMGGLSYLTDLDLHIPDIGRLSQYVEIVAERSARRRLVLAGANLIRNAADGDEELVPLIHKAVQGLTGLMSRAVSNGLRSIQNAIDRLSEDIENPARAREVLQGVPSGFRTWDRLGPGLAPGKVIVVAGRPGMGKTSFALNVVRHVAVIEGRPVGIFSLEMSERELALCLLCSEADVPTRSLRRGYLTRQELDRLIKAASRLYNAPIFIDDSAGISMSDVEARARQFKMEHEGAGLLALDYLQLVTAGRGRRDLKRNLEVAELSRRSKQLARALEIPFMVLSQLSRENTRRTDPRPVLADLAESGAIESDADLVAFVHRPEYYRPDDPSLKGLAELIVAKYRGGETGSVPLLWNGPTQTFRTFEERAAGPDPF